jgi:hypothetical protein
LGLPSERRLISRRGRSDIVSLPEGFVLKKAPLRAVALSTVAFIALAACVADTDRVAELEAQVEELEGQVSSIAATSTSTMATTQITRTTLASPTTATESESWEARFPGFEKLFGSELPIEVENWCKARPEEVLAGFYEKFEVNDFEEHWQLAMSELEGFDHDVEAWRQGDRYEDGFWAWRTACRAADARANPTPIEVDPLLTVEVTQEAALWCSTRPDEVLAAFAALHAANNTGEIDDLWTIAGFLLQRFDYDIEEWRQRDSFGTGLWAWRASCQVAYDSR